MFGFVAGKKFQRTNIIAGYVNGETIAECVYDYTTDGEVFSAWVEQFLVAALKPGQVVFMDNAAFHKHPRTREAIKAAGYSLIYLPPYSPDLNPIEKFWANLKGKLANILHLHRRNARSAKGKKVIGLVKGKKFHRRNIVAGYVNGKTIAECVYDCTTDGEVFNAWVEQSLAAALKPGQVVPMDNAAFHKHPRTREAIEAAGCSLIYLPPYFPRPQSHRKILGEPQRNTLPYPPPLSLSLRRYSICLSQVR